MFSKAIKDLQGGLNLWHVWFYQAYHEISAKYKRTVLGSLWIVGSMVFVSGAFAIVTSAIYHQNMSETLPRVMGGIMAFNLVAFVLNEAPEVYMSNSGIIKNHAYPFTYYSFEAVTKTFMVFAHNVIVFEIILAVCQKLAVPNWSILVALPMIYINMFTWGALIGMLSSRFRDMRFLLPYLTTVVMFCSPIMFQVSQFTGVRKLIVDLNPFYPFIDMVRLPLMGGTLALQYWMTATGITVVGIILWLIFFNAFRNRISFWV